MRRILFKLVHYQFNFLTPTSLIWSKCRAGVNFDLEEEARGEGRGYQGYLVRFLGMGAVGWVGTVVVFHLC